jgi:hypothetical protein
MLHHCSANVICSVANLCREWLLNGIKLRDQHLRVCAHFMSMSGDFLEFVQVYCCQDSVTIESGNSCFAPQWKVLGQLKYLEAYHEQLNRTYHGQTGKILLAQVKWLELNNKEFALYPSVRTLEGMS